jgi:hypothetical protein|tara:strand:+ start:2244 stop:2513 length:270 start_codon:yes stop_codon:yes gene_type:complete
MADENNAGTVADGSQLRERLSAKPQHLRNADDAKRKVLELNDHEDKSKKDEQDKRTFGRTPDGTGAYSQCSELQNDSNIMSCIWASPSH